MANETTECRSGTMRMLGSVVLISDIVLSS